MTCKQQHTPHTTEIENLEVEIPETQPNNHVEVQGTPTNTLIKETKLYNPASTN